MKQIKAQRVCRVVKWRCPLCGQVYPTKRDAEACLAVGLPRPKFAPGDVVYAGDPVTGWYDGDKRWIKKYWRAGQPRQTSYPDFGFDYYFIVTRVFINPYDRHSRIYDCETGAMTGSEGWRFQRFTHRTLQPCSGPSDCGDLKLVSLKALRRLPRVIRDAARDWVGHSVEEHGVDGALACRPSYVKTPSKSRMA